MSLNRVRGWLAVAVHFSDLFVNGALAFACWWGASFLWTYAKVSFAAAGMPPRTYIGAYLLATSPDLVPHLQLWGEAAVAVTLAVLLALSAAEGSWWTVRRLSRPA